MRLTRGKLLGLFIVAFMLMAILLAYRIHRQCEFRITNTGSTPITNLQCKLATSDSSWTETYDQVPGGKSISVKRSVSDFMLNQVNFRIGDKDYQWIDRAITTPSECFQLTVDGAGNVTGAYE